MSEIKFGTDGWRGVIADDFTFANVRMVSQAVADYLNSFRKEETKVAVGYDTRFLSNRYAECVSEVLAGNGIKAILSQTPVPSPCLSFMIKNLGLDGGVMVTASHNPPQFNGIKFKASYAGSADKSITSNIESFLYKNEPKILQIDEAKKTEAISVIDFFPPYIETLKTFVDFEMIANSGFKIVADAMYGAQDHLVEKILSGTACKITTIHGEPNPVFGGIYPEPIPPHTDELQKTVVDLKADVGLATDGDGDRSGAMKSNGEFVSAHQILSMLLIHLHKNRKLTGKVAKTISTTTLVEKIAEKYGLELIETPIGFKYICELLRTDDILIGGEESGGNGYQGYIPERDGTLTGLLLLEMMAFEKKNLDEIMAEIDAEYGTFRYKRIDIEYPWEMKDKLLKWLNENPPEEINSSKIATIKTFDGVKFIAENDDWLLIRPSGTEPVLRIYAEAKSSDEVDGLLKLGKKLSEDVLK